MLASMCLALALYHEARGEPVSGQMMVAKVIVNRIQSNRFPNKMCDVVMQPRQFSFVRNGKIPKPKHKDEWIKSQKLATEIIKDPSILPYSPADHYHTTNVRPVWRRKLYRIVRIRKHIFYSYTRPQAPKTSLRPKTRR
jgi:N-acetylmuramoyl-L-alanine amidase